MAFTMTSSAVLVRPFTPNCASARRPSGAVPSLTAKNGVFALAISHCV